MKETRILNKKSFYFKMFSKQALFNKIMRVICGCLIVSNRIY